MSKSKKLIYLLPLLLILLFSSIALFACGEQEKEVYKIEIIGNYRDVYYINESFDQNAKLLVTYVDGSTATKNITKNMLVGFKTSEICDNKNVAIIYGGLLIEKTYSVYYFKYGYYNASFYTAENENEPSTQTDYIRFLKDGTVVDYSKGSENPFEYNWLYDNGNIRFITQDENEITPFKIEKPDKFRQNGENGSYTIFTFAHN